MQSLLAQANAHFGHKFGNEPFELVNGKIVVTLDTVTDEMELADIFYNLPHSFFTIVNEHGPAGGNPVVRYVFETPLQFVMFMQWYDKEFEIDFVS
jgi:hypothetical protein